MTTTDFSKFNPRAYLEEIHSDGGKGQANRDILISLIDEYSFVPNKTHLLELGGGPTIYQLITATSKVSSITFAEFSTDARAEIEAWVQGKKTAWNWDAWFETTMRIESGEKPTQNQISERQQELKTKIKEIIACDVRNQNPLGDEKYLHFFDAIAMNYVIDSITESFSQWSSYLDNALSLLKPQGILIYNAISDVDTRWGTGGVKFPGIDVLPPQLYRELTSRGFEIKYLQQKYNQECEGHKAHLFSCSVRNIV
jgi:hypothetical protein